MDNKRPFTPAGVLALATVFIVALAGISRRNGAQSVAAMVPVSANAWMGASDGTEPYPSELATESSERSIGASAVAVVESADAWRVGGHVSRGMNGRFAHAPLLIRVIAGTRADGDVIVTEARTRADENGSFDWATTTPTGPVTVVVTPDVEGHKVYADSVTITEGDPPPSNLRPFAYVLDAQVHGRVVDPDGQPIHGARVIAHLAEVLTGDDGAYTLPMASDYRSFSIVAVAAGFTEGGLALGAVVPGERNAPDLVLRRDYSVQGRVVNAEGAPVSGATVCTYPRERNQTLTDAEGRFHLGGLDPELDGVRITALMDGFVSASAQVRPGAEGHEPEPELGPELVLTRGTRIVGRVVTESGQPVKNAQVSIGTPYPREDMATFSDESGAFTLDVVRPGSQTVWALRPGKTAGQARIQVEEGAESLDGVEVVMPPGLAVSGVVLDEAELPVVEVQVTPSLTGRVVDGETGEPIRAFTVRLVAPPSAHTGSAFWDISYDWRGTGMSFDDPNGVWSTGIERIARGTALGVEVSAPGYASEAVDRVSITLDPDPNDLRIELNAGARLRGFVTDARTGVPMANARLRRFTGGDPGDTQRYVHDEDCEARTDDQGGFEMENVPFGSMYLVVDETDLPVCIDGPFEVSAGAIDRAIAITEGARLIGRYLDGDGQPLANQRVTLAALETPVDRPPSYTVDTDADGAFEFENLVPGPHHLRGSVTSAGASAPVGTGMLQLVEVEDGKTIEVDLRPTGHATLTGTIECEGDLPHGLSVDLVPQGESGVWASRSQSAAVRNGTFTATHLDPGEWRARVFYQDVGGQLFTGHAKVEVPAEGAAEVHITMRPFQR